MPAGAIPGSWIVAAEVELQQPQMQQIIQLVPLVGLPQLQGTSAVHSSTAHPIQAIKQEEGPEIRAGRPGDVWPPTNGNVDKR